MRNHPTLGRRASPLGPNISCECLTMCGEASPASYKSPALAGPKDVFQGLPSEGQASCPSQDSSLPGAPMQWTHTHRVSQSCDFPKQETAAFLTDRCEVTNRMTTMLGVHVTPLASSSPKGVLKRSYGRTEGCALATWNIITERGQ